MQGGKPRRTLTGARVARNGEVEADWGALLRGGRRIEARGGCAREEKARSDSCAHARCNLRVRIE